MITMGEVWDRTTDFLGDALPAILAIALSAILLPTALQAIIAPLADQSAIARLAVNALALALSLVGLWGQLAIVALAIDPAIGRGGAMQLARRRLPAMIAVAAILLIGLIVLMLPIPVALGLSGYDLQGAMGNGQVEIPPGAAGFTGLYALVLLAVLLFLASRLALIPAIVVGERRGPGALRRSFALTRGIAWKIVGVAILFGIVVTVARLATRTVFGSVLQLAFGGGAFSVATLLTAILVAAVTTGFTVLAMAFTGKLYLAVRGAGAAVAPPA